MTRTSTVAAATTVPSLQPPVIRLERGTATPAELVAIAVVLLSTATSAPHGPHATPSPEPAEPHSTPAGAVASRWRRAALPTAAPWGSQPIGGSR